jgi:hypothetical protein
MEMEEHMPLPPLVTDADQVTKNIRTFNDAIKPDAADSAAKHALARIIPFVQSWLVLPQPGGDYLFGPSKFIGYADMSARIYAENHVALNGRLTERRLAKWATPVPNSDPRHPELMRGLVALCSRFLANPNGRARLALLRAPPKVPASVPAVGDEEHVRAVLALVARMPAAAQHEIKRQLGR